METKTIRISKKNLDVLFYKNQEYVVIQIDKKKTRDKLVLKIEDWHTLVNKINDLLL